VPRSRDIAIFVRYMLRTTTNLTKTRPIAFPIAHARGVIIILTMDLALLSPVKFNPESIVHDPEFKSSYPVIIYCEFRRFT
jgi:hypothetical protein